MQPSPQSSIDLPGIKKLRSGKVREVFDLGDTLLFVVTDRLSAFDVILPDPIPHKGAVLNQLSAFWFKRFGNIDPPQDRSAVADHRLLLIDECLTPDSSRFWPADQYAVGQSPPSFDKQFVRDYLETLDWDKTPPAPKLPADVIARTAAKYV